MRSSQLGGRPNSGSLAKCLILVAVVSLAWLQLRVMHSRSSTGFESSSWFLVSPHASKSQGGGEKDLYLRVQRYRQTYDVDDVDLLHDIVKRLQCPSSDRATTALAVRNISSSWIPQRIVQIGRSKKLSSMESVARDGVLSWLARHPCYDYIFLDDQAIEAFLGRANPRYLQAYHSLANGGERADLARYIYMYTMGGIYADTDTRVVKPADHWNLREGDSFVVGLEADFSSDAVAHEWVYARARSASLHAFAVSPKNPLLQRVIETVVTNIENPNKVYDEVHARGIGLPSHLETIFKTGPGPFSDVVLGGATMSGGVSSDPHTRIVGLWGFSGKHSQGSRFYAEQLGRSKADRTVFVEHMNLGSWLKPYPKFKLAGSMDAIFSGSSLVGGEWIAARRRASMTGEGRTDALWCHEVGPARRVDGRGFLHLQKDGELTVGLGKGPRDPGVVVIFKKELDASVAVEKKGIFDLHLDPNGVLTLSLLTKPGEHGGGSMGKQLLWSLPGNVEAQAAADSAGGNSWELALDLDPKPRLCVYPKTAQTPSLKGGASLPSKQQSTWAWLAG